MRSVSEAFLSRLGWKNRPKLGFDETVLANQQKIFVLPSVSRKNDY